MYKICIPLAAIFMFSLQLDDSYGAYWNKFAAVSDASCAVYNIKLLSLLNLLCNNTQTTSIQMRDACYGCFFRAGSIVNGPTQLSSLNDCARLYISQSGYAICAANLQSIVDGNRPTTSDATAGFCYTGYCDFVRCVRRINAQQLIATCYAESLGSRVLEADLDRVYFYTNVTSCILGKSRCSTYNPISGELLGNIITAQTVVAKKVSAAAAVASNGWVSGHLSSQPLYFNSLQIAETGDVRVITFPTATTSVSDIFCSTQTTLQQSGFGTYNC